MRKITSFWGALILGITFLSAQEAKTYFVNMPDSLSPLLTAVNRADCVDFLENNMKAEVVNRFGEKSEMTELSSDYVRMQMTTQSSWQMKLLALNDSTHVICEVRTVCAPVCDSSIRFYTTDWQELSAADYLVPPTLDDFLALPDSAANYDVWNAYRQADMLLVKADFATKEPVLLFTLTTPEYMGKEEAEKLQQLLVQTRKFLWADGRFIKE